MRKGQAIGQGKGYKNIQGRDPAVHSQSARGIKQIQKINYIVPPPPNSEILFTGGNRIIDTSTKVNKLSNNELRQFSGTNEYHRWSILFPNYKLTDGTNYLAEKTGSFWFMDIIGSYQNEPKFRKEEFQNWKLQQTNNKEAVVIATDGNGNKLVSQKIPYTDFFDKYEGKDIEVIFSNGVILLPSEN